MSESTFNVSRADLIVQEHIQCLRAHSMGQEHIQCMKSRFNSSGAHSMSESTFNGQEHIQCMKSRFYGSGAHSMFKGSSSHHRHRSSSRQEGQTQSERF